MDEDRIEPQQKPRTQARLEGAASFARELETLTGVARSLTLSADPESLAREILKWTQAFIPGAVGRFWAISDDGRTRSLVASIGLRHARQERSLGPGQGLGGLCVAQKEALVSLDVSDDPRFLKKDWARSEGLVSCIMLPLAHRKRVYGNLSVFTRTRHPFSENEMRLLEAFAAQAAAALANAALYRESIRKTERLESLNRVNASLASSRGADETLELIVEEAPKLLRLDGAGLRLIKGDHLVLARQRGLPARLMIKPSLNVGESLSGRVAKENRPIAVGHIELDQDITPDYKAAVMAEGAQCWIGVPVRHQDRLMGVLMAMGKQRRTFTEDDIDLLSSFADHAAIAIENGRLYDAAQQELVERRKAQEALRKHQEKLEEMVEERTASLKEAQEQLLRKERLAALGQLTASVSHELRTPLGTIKTSLHTLEKIMEGGGRPLQQILDRTMRNMARCDAIVSDLLDYTGSPRLKRIQIALGPWIDAVLDEQTLPEALTLRRQLSNGVEVAIDEERFRRVIINVLQNALQAMTDAETQDNPREQSVCVRCRGESKRVVVEVEDNGPGIPAEILPQIFEPLFSTKGFGMGLGLPIVQQIMQHHEGGIEVHSRAGRGTRVELWLPRPAS